MDGKMNLSPYLLRRPDRKIRPLIVLGLGGLFSEGFCDTVDEAAGVVEEAARVIDCNALDLQVGVDLA
jgi:hypothetical protein